MRYRLFFDKLSLVFRGGPMVFLRKINKSWNRGRCTVVLRVYPESAPPSSLFRGPPPRAFEPGRPSDNKIILRHNRQCSAG